LRRRARRRAGRGGEGAFQQINITPFTDVLLVLLIIFLIAGSSLAPTGVEVGEIAQEPTVGETGGEASKDDATLFVSQNGSITYVHGKEVKKNVDLGSIHPGAPLNLTASPETPAEVVIKVYDELLLNEFTAVRLASPQDKPSFQ
jgi:biopolymer transport protein ExbD